MKGGKQSCETGNSGTLLGSKKQLQVQNTHLKVLGSTNIKPNKNSTIMTKRQKQLTKENFNGLLPTSARNYREPVQKHFSKNKEATQINYQSSQNMQNLRRKLELATTSSNTQYIYIQYIYI